MSHLDTSHSHPTGSSLLEVAEAHRASLKLKERRFPAGASLVSTAEEADAIYIVRKGLLRVYTPTEEGTNVFLSELGPGDLVGEVAALSSRPRASIVEAIEDTEALVCERSAFIELLRSCPDSALEMMRSLCLKLRAINQRHLENVTLSMAARLARELRRMAKLEQDGVWRVRSAPTHTQLAERIGSQREAVTKRLRHLARTGVLKARRGLIEFVKPELL